MNHIANHRPLHLLPLLLLAAFGISASAQQATVSAQQARPSIAPSAATDDANLRKLQKLVETGHPELALKQISDLRAENTGSASTRTRGLYRVEGLAFYAQGQLKSADQSFAEALIEDKTDQESAQMRGLTLFRLGRPSDAIPLLVASGGSSDAGTRKADPNYILALCYIDTRKYDEARHAFAAQFGMPPDGAAAYLLAARMLLRREYLPVAHEFAEKAVALQPQLPLAHALLGEIALAGNHLDEAIAQFEQERTANPLEPAVYDRLGDAYGRAARYREAQASLQEAVLLEPNSTGPYILLGKNMLKQGDAVGAANYLERAVKMDPANYMSHSLLGQAYRTMGRVDDATRETATAQRLQTAAEPKLESVR